MGLKNNSKELNNYANISPLSSDIDVPCYTNTSVSYNKKYPYSSQSSTTSSSETSILKKFTSIQNPNGLIYHRQNNVYANLCKLPTDATIDMGMKSLSLDENNNNKQVYENVKLIQTSSPIYINLKQDEGISRSLSSTNFIDIETKTKQTIEKSEVNITPNCNDKRDLYRTKISSTITKILPTIRQRRVLHRSRRYNRRNSTSFRTTMNSNAIRRQQQQHSNHRSIIKNNQREHSADKSVSNQLYNEIQPAIPLDNQSINSYYTEEIFESPTGLDEENLSWYPVPDTLVPQVFSTSENGGSIEQGELTNEEEEEEELHPHNTFEDFLLRRPSKSSCSSLASVTNTLISEKMSPDIPSPINRRSSGVTLSLDKRDVDFIHNIIQRTHGHERVSNRITALREAYIRAENKRNDLLKIKKVTQINQNKTKPKIPIKHSMITSKIRQELERYDELPIHKKAHFNIEDDDDDDDSIYSTNDDYRYRHRKLPPVPSTTNKIINFVTTLKRQIQKNFQEIRSKILIETMANPSQRRSTLHNTSGLSHRYRSRPKTSYNMIRRANSHQSVEHSYPFHRHQFSRSHSDASQIHSYHPLSFDRQSSHRPRTFRITPHSPRRQRKN